MMDTPMVVPIDATAALRRRRVARIDARADMPCAAQSETGRLKKRVRELTVELAAAREAARLHLARELHDGVGAELTAARFALANVEASLPAGTSAEFAAALAVARQSLDAACEASRNVVADLHAPHLEAVIVGAVAQCTRGFAGRTPLTTGVVCAAHPPLT